MATKLESARQKAEELIQKDNERIQLESTLQHIQERTDPDGNITVSLDKMTFKIPASTVMASFQTQKTAKEAELDVLATQFDGK